jgi:uncharacterized protein (TIGR02270 family)
MNSPAAFDVIPALIARHASDAAFYWMQLDQSAASFRLTPARYRQFNERLDAHLEGLAIAGPAGIQPAFAALERWKKPGETFVCTWLASQHPEDEALKVLTGYVEKQPDTLLRGAISALAWLPRDVSAPMINRWTGSEADIPAQVIALRALALLGPESAPALATPMPGFLASPVPFIRAAACRVLARLKPEFSVPFLHDALHDDDLAVRAEAAISLSTMPEPGEAGAAMWKCVALQAGIHREATGWYRMQATRRLNRWARYLAWLAPIGHADLPALFDYLPPRAGLTFALYHGDTTHLDRILAAMADPETARYAGWVWQTLTGVDLETARLTLPEPEAASERGPITDARLDADNGLPLPNATAIRNYKATTLSGTRTLLGKELTAAFAAEVLGDRPQAIRAIAAQYLRMTLPHLAPNIRASAQVQQTQMAALRTAIKV